MRTFTCFTTDRRYAVPTLSFILAADEERACEIARRELLSAGDHTSIELHENGRCIFTEMRSFADSRLA